LVVSVLMVVGCKSTPEQAVALVSGPVEVSGNSAVAEHLRQREPDARAERVTEYLAKHPGQTAELQARLTKGAVFTGMTKEQLKAVLGEPWLKTAKTDEMKNREVWMYLADIEQEDRFLFENGQLKNWRLAKKDEPVARRGQKKGLAGRELVGAK
jgi:hypothetical protein